MRSPFLPTSRKTNNRTEYNAPLPTQTGPIERHHREIHEVQAGKSCYTEPPYSLPRKAQLLPNSAFETTFTQPLRLFTTSLPTAESDTFQACSQPAAKGHNTSTKEFVIAFQVSCKIKGKKKKKSKGGLMRRRERVHGFKSPDRPGWTTWG